MDLFSFQEAASSEIARKYLEYAKDPLLVTRTRQVPFYQNLVSITGSGKTVILADAISQIRSQLPVEPIVLWLSKGKVVVWQTYANLTSGRYTKVISGYKVKPLTECKLPDIESSSSGLVLVATVGKFNQRDRTDGDRKIFQLALDLADVSLWEMLKKRRNSAGIRRPFIVVYDEGHNLTDQQTELLLELEPDALIAASATMKIPEALSTTIDRLKRDKKWSNNDFATVVKSSDVVLSGLIKQQILLGGYVTPMEVAVDELIGEWKHVSTAAETLGLPFAPKAIYVSNTNVVAGSAITDGVLMPFHERQARPILIWRHLVEHHGIDPSTIAVYCNLKFDPKFPHPPTFNLFAGGDKDYDNFIAGDYQHIIFNLTLQEGWDDPACYFAYIDKDMGSKDQVTQIVGRVLRQPGAQHYLNPSLNTAHFYVRTDEKQVFEQVLREVKDKIAAEAPEISLTVYSGSKGSAAKTTLQPKRKRELPEVSADFSDAIQPIREIFESINDYRNDFANTVGKGGRMQVLQSIGINGEKHEEWVEIEHSNRVTARWIFSREVQKTYSKALNLCDVEAPKLDAMIEYNSRAAEHMREAARKIVDAYLQHSRIVHNFGNTTAVPEVKIDPENVKYFTSALHDGYSDLNGFEEEFAVALDKTQRVWFRNPSRGVFEVPRLTLGSSKNFNPDFVVWIDRGIVAIDTKGDHLIVEDAGRKLLTIEKSGSGNQTLAVCLITRGTWNDRIEKQNQLGFTVWINRNGRPHPLHAQNINEAVQRCLRQG